jgi:hypothetical protein
MGMGWGKGAIWRNSFPNNFPEKFPKNASMSCPKNFRKKIFGYLFRKYI